MRRVNRITVGVLGMLLLLSLFSPALLTAQTNDGSFNLLTSPLPINLAGKPGTTLTTNVRVKNGGIRTEKLKVTLMKFSAFGEEGKPGLFDREAGDDYFDWVSFSPSLFDAPPNEWMTVKIKIALPKTAAFGYYYAVIFSRASEPVVPQSKQSVIVGSTAILVLVDAQVPNAKRQASIESFSVSKTSYEFLPADFKVRVHNSGNIHLIPTGNIFITRGGKTIATLSINSASGNVLPNSNRIFTASWKEGFPSYIQREAGGKVLLDNSGKAITDLKWDVSKISTLRFGRYTAKLLLVYDDGTRDIPLEATVGFWVIPWRILGVGFILLLLIGAGLWSLLRRPYTRLRNKTKRHEKTR